MHCRLFRCDVPLLISTLTGAELLTRWQEAVGQELPSVADRPLLAHLKRLSSVATRVLSSGFEATARDELKLTDALLTDLFAVATWHQWALPVEDLGESDIDVNGVSRGLLGADSSDGAGLWVIDHATIALARQRQASNEADWSQHARA